MKKSATLVVMLGLAVAGCGAPQGVMQISNCRTLTNAQFTALRDTKCEAANRRPVTITVSANDIDISPKKACARRGGNLNFRFKKADGYQADVIAVIIPKDADNGWMVLSSKAGKDKAGKDENKNMRIPRGVQIRGNYQYSVMTNTGLCEDPMVHIERSNLAPE